MQNKRIYYTCLDFMVVIACVMSEFANIIAFYLSGNKNDYVRKIISWGLICGVTFFLLLYCVSKFIKGSKTVRRKIFISMTPVIVTFLVLLIGFVSGNEKVLVIQKAIYNILYSVPLICGAIYIVLEDRLADVYSKVKYVFMIMLPYYLIASVYFWGLTLVTDTGDGYGGIGYLGIGYSAVTMYALLLGDKIVNARSRRLIYFFEILGTVVCTLLCMFSGSRGVLIAWFVVSITAVFFAIMKRSARELVPIIISFASLIIFSIAAPADNAALIRQISFVSDIKQGSIQESIVSEDSKEIVDKLMSSANEGKGWSETVADMQVQVAGEKKPASEIAEGSEGASSDEVNLSQEAVYSITNGNMARSYLYRLAITEGRQNLLTGIGILGYQSKYQTYAHNVFLECFADFGILALACLLMVCLWCVIVLYKKAMQNRLYSVVFILLSAQVVKMFLSGDLYLAPFLLFVISLTIMKSMWPVRRENDKKL